MVAATTKTEKSAIWSILSSEENINLDFQMAEFAMIQYRNKKLEK